MIETCVLGKGYRKNTGKPRHTLKEGDSFQVDPAVMLWQDRLVSNLCSQSGHCQAPGNPNCSDSLGLKNVIFSMNSTCNCLPLEKWKNNLFSVSKSWRRGQQLLLEAWPLRLSGAPLASLAGENFLLFISTSIFEGKSFQITTQPFFNHLPCCPFSVRARDAKPCRW